MITPLMKLLIAIVLLYLLITIFIKFTKMVMRVAIVLLIIGIFVLGYQSVGEMWSKSPTEALGDQWVEKAEPLNNTEPDTPAGAMDDDLASLENDLAELEDIEKELNASDMEINSTEVNEII